MRDVASFARWCASRRALLAGTGAAGLIGVLAACGADEGGGEGGGAGDGAGSGGASGAASEGAGAAGGVLATTADVPVGGGTVANGVLIVQPTAGEFKAYDAACPHQGVQVGAPEDGVVTCPAHNSTFNAADGSRRGGPAPRGLTEIAITVDRDDILRG